MAKRNVKTVTQALNQLDRIVRNYNSLPNYGGDRGLWLDDVYGVLEGSLEEGLAKPNDDYRKVYSRITGIPLRESQTNTIDNVASLRSNIIGKPRARGNASTASRGNSNG